MAKLAKQLAKAVGQEWGHDCPTHPFLPCTYTVRNPSIEGEGKLDTNHRLAFYWGDFDGFLKPGSRLGYVRFSGMKRVRLEADKTRIDELEVATPPVASSTDVRLNECHASDIMVRGVPEVASVNLDLYRTSTQQLVFLGQSGRVQVQSSTIDRMIVEGAPTTIDILCSEVERLEMSGVSCRWVGLRNTKVAKLTCDGLSSPIFSVWHTTLGEASFCRSWIPEADFTGSDIRGAKFYGAHLWRAHLPHLSVSETVLFDNGMRYIPALFKGGKGVWIVPCLDGNWYVYAPGRPDFFWVPLDTVRDRIKVPNLPPVDREQFKCHLHRVPIG